jgi:hypothetical protein
VLQLRSVVCYKRYSALIILEHVVWILNEAINLQTILICTLKFLAIMLSKEIKNRSLTRTIVRWKSFVYHLEFSCRNASYSKRTVRWQACHRWIKKVECTYPLSQSIRSNCTNAKKYVDSCSDQGILPLMWDDLPQTLNGRIVAYWKGTAITPRF